MITDQPEVLFQKEFLSESHKDFPELQFWDLGLPERSEYSVLIKEQGGDTSVTNIYWSCVLVAICCSYSIFLYFLPRSLAVAVVNLPKNSPAGVRLEKGFWCKCRTILAATLLLLFHLLQHIVARPSRGVLCSICSRQPRNPPNVGPWPDVLLKLP